MRYYKRKAQIKAGIRNFFRIPDIATIIKKIDAICGDILSCSAITSSKRRYKAWQQKLQILVLYEKYRTSNIPLSSSGEVTEFISILNSACEILKDAQAPESVKAIIEDFYRRRMKVMVDFWPDKPYTKELFARRKEIHKDSPIMSGFLEGMLDHEVYRHFYEKKPVKDKKDYDKMTQQERLKHDKSIAKEAREWGSHYNRLCKRFGLNEYARDYCASS